MGRRKKNADLNKQITIDHLKKLDAEKNKNEILKAKLEVIDIICESNPKVNKTDLIDKVLCDNILKSKQNVDDECILEKITINNKVYYRDNNKNIIGIDKKLAGFYDYKNNIYSYILFKI
jgi:hypothetical protein